MIHINCDTVFSGGFCGTGWIVCCAWPGNASIFFVFEKCRTVCHFGGESLILQREIESKEAEILRLSIKMTCHMKSHPRNNVYDGAFPAQLPRKLRIAMWPALAVQ